MSLSQRLLAARSFQALWPAGLGGRTILVLTAAVVLVHLGTVLVYDDTMGDRTGRTYADQVAGRLATAARA